MFRKILAWAQKNERHLGGILFVGGFVTDLIAFTLLDISIVNVFFAVYLALAAVCVFGSHIVSTRELKRMSTLRRSLLVFLPLAAQYLIGGLLSGFLIFYTKSSVLSASWPFLILLALVFVGNEWFRKYRDRLAFIAVLLFFTTYAYAIFALPLFVHALGPVVFLLSTALAVFVFALFLFLLWKTGKARLKENLYPIVGSSLAIVLVMVGSYFTGLVPPIPLVMKEGGIYHSLRHENGIYIVQGETQRAWWDPRPETVHITPGSSLTAFASVFAPIRFSTSVVHRWERYDELTKSWVLESRIEFPISGGRAEGYRGYSEKELVEPGTWRVSVETPSGQVIGRIDFVVRVTTAAPQLREERY